MGKLYVIGVGGTGSRVMHSLLMLLASGIKINASEIVPLIIDTDDNNGNLDEFKKLSACYTDIHNRITQTGNEQFFGAKVKEVENLSISGSQFFKLSSLINYNGITDPKTKGFIDLLFSQENLDMPLDKGFIGNPNIGTIVLNYIINNSDEFKQFTQGFAEGDRIFIISSIFGGTGAAGFPLLVNNLRHNNRIDNASIINDAIIGAISILPYFTVANNNNNNNNSNNANDDNNYEVDSNTFMLKSKTALSYYDKYVTNDVNALYYIGDYKSSSYPNKTGGSEQKNPSCFIEVASALSVIDFMDYEKDATDKTLLSNVQKFFEFGIEEDQDTIGFNLLHNETNFTKPLISQQFFRQYYKGYLEKSLNTNLKWLTDIGVTSDFLNNDLAKSLNKFFNFYDTWLSDLNNVDHARKFIPFKEITVSENNLLSNINGKEPNRTKGTLGFGANKIPEIIMNDFFNDTNTNSLSGNTEQKFMDVINKGIQKIYNNHFNNN